jgi:hypothetical protein
MATWRRAGELADQPAQPASADPVVGLPLVPTVEDQMRAEGHQGR